jgi:hypothetical protein
MRWILWLFGRRTMPEPSQTIVEPVIGHFKDDHRMGRNYLAGGTGDATNAILAAADYNADGSWPR